MSYPRDSAGGVDPLARRVRATPDRIGLVDDATGTTLRYDELDDEVDTLAGHLAGLGLEAGDHLGLLAETSVDAVRTVHAAWRLGVVLVPLNVRLAESELARQAERCDLDALACTGETASTATAVADCPLVNVDRGDADGVTTGTDFDGVVNVRALTAEERREGAPVTWDPDDTALLSFTSGTTGEPKAVELTMGNLLVSATASAFRLGVLPSDRWLLCLPIYHMGGLAPVVRSAHYGTALVVQEGFDPAAVARATRERDVTGLSLVPTQLRRILDVPGELSNGVRTVLLGGAPAPPELIERCRRRDVPVHPTYGLTETASQVATATPEQAFAHEGTVGQPLLCTEVTIVDEDRRPLPVGERGEIVVSGPTVTPGYYDDPGATRRAFCSRGLLTGDVGQRDEEGRLRIWGRRDDLIVTGGENVHPEEVVAAIRDHVDVSDVAVVGLPDPDWGERIAALVVPAPGRSLDVETLLGHCRERLADFKVPKTLEVVHELPRTASGTVDREAVRERLRE